MKDIFAPLIAILALWIAYQQYKVQKYKAKFDLFERRMKIYESIRDALENIVRDATTKNVNFNELYTAIRHSRFLFDDELNSYLKEIEKKIIELMITNNQLFGTESLPIGEERTKVVHENSEYFTWLTSQLSTLEDKFSNFMRINKI